MVLVDCWGLLPGLCLLSFRICSPSLRYSSCIPTSRVTLNQPFPIIPEGYTYILCDILQNPWLPATNETTRNSSDNLLHPYCGKCGVPILLRNRMEEVGVDDLAHKACALHRMCCLPFTIHYKCVTGSRRVERGEQCVVTLSTALQLSAWLQLLLPAGRGGPGRRPSARLPPPPSPPHTTTTTRINRSATPYKRSTEVHASQYSAPPTMTSHVVQD
ncbi:uncharacterized protein LOC122979620 [Thunnus albacares]|uniref:uncharacterized protein LOC122979620 n=1 Tax=Thunnus albacares TaxID=8236 RepID=UPI001CF63395|nr:uncharacterized protein LOC122979620 [Thunnus albacares]XP_044203148.1 uncharacterized protein LOC122979620 [Thunnus albacares]